MHVGLSIITMGRVHAESVRAILKHGEEGVINPALEAGAKLAILVEEVGEVARAMTYDNNQGPQHLYDELIQVANVAASWAQSLEGELQ